MEVRPDYYNLQGLFGSHALVLRALDGVPGVTVERWDTADGMATRVGMVPPWAFERVWHLLPPSEVFLSSQGDTVWCNVWTREGGSWKALTCEGAGPVGKYAPPTEEELDLALDLLRAYVPPLMYNEVVHTNMGVTRVVPPKQPAPGAV